jgi:TIR domain/Pentapeptide repeats (8 copies)
LSFNGTLLDASVWRSEPPHSAARGCRTTTDIEFTPPLGQIIVSMANPEHVERLKGGIEEWNHWRLTHNRDDSGVLVDLREAQLNEADLSGANLSWAELGRANFSKADLSGANLGSAMATSADLSEADLSGADLSGATLNGADFRAADLVGAKLVSADLSAASFVGTYLSGADFTNAHVRWTIFGGLDLSQVKGLDTLHHSSPSTIGIDTIYESGGNIPEVFLRGSGVPDNLISYMSSLVGTPIEFYSCFISYSHADKTFARRLHDALQLRGIRCWLDEHQLLPGDDIYDHVDRGIRHWDKVLLCCSKASLSSWWVDDEIGKAFAKEQTLMKKRGKRILALVPLDLDGHLFRWQDAKADQIRRRLAADFKHWERDNAKFDEQIEKVVRALRADDGGREKPPRPLL